jgi:transcriptional regulator with XRE-family HTH domain
MILSGGTDLLIPPPPSEQAEEWLETSLRRWERQIVNLPEGHPARIEPGHFAVAYSLSGGFPRPSLGSLMEMLPQATIRYTGWPEFWVPTKESIKPRPVDGVIECWIGGDLSRVRDGAHSDFWRISPDGKAFLIRGLQEDGQDYGVEPGTVFDITTPTWRLGEALMHAAALAKILGDDDAEVVLVAEWSGLKGRTLVAPPDSSRMMVGGHAAHQDRYRGTVRSRASEIPNALVELVSQLMFPLYEIFSFFQLPTNLPAQELLKMRRNIL